MDNDPGVLVSACLFGDGAGAAVLSNKPNARTRKIEWKNTRTLLGAKDRDLLRFEQKNGMLRNILSAEVPALAARYAEEVLNATLRDAGIGRERVMGRIWHAGGRDVLMALQARLGLSAGAGSWSGSGLRDY